MADARRSFPPPVDAVEHPPLPPFPQARDRRTGHPFIPRNKIKIRWVEDEGRRRATLKKRRNGVIKKAEELSILCDVQVSAVIFSPGEEEPAVYPSLERAASMCRTFRQLPDFNRTHHMSSHPQFVEEIVAKKNKKVWSRQQEMIEKETVTHVYNGLAGADIRHLDTDVLDRVQKMIQKMIKDLRKKCSISQPMVQAAPPPALAEQPRRNSPANGDESSFVDAIHQYADENNVV